jgi:hypothetical protein
VSAAPENLPDASGKILLNAGSSEAGAHRQELFRMCEQKFAYRMEEKKALELAPVAVADTAEDAPDADESERPHLIIGSLVHIGLAHHYARIRQWQRQQDPELYYSAEDAIVMLAGENSGWAKHVGISIDIVRDHFSFWPHDHERFRVLEVEQVHRVMVGADREDVRSMCGPAGFLYTQRVDLVLEDAAGRVYIFDHKGVGHFRGKETRTFTLSGQFLGYQVIGSLTWGRRFAGVVANLFERKEQKRRYKRVSPEPAPFALQCFKENLIETELDIRRKLAAPRNTWHFRKAFSEQICRTIYGECEHFAKCQRGPQG